MSDELADKLRQVRREVLTRALTVPPATPVPENIRTLSALHLNRFYDAFANFIVDADVNAFNNRREPLRLALLDAGLPPEVALDLDRVIAQQLINALPEYASTIRDRLVRSQMLITETNIKRYFPENDEPEQ